METIKLGAGLDKEILSIIYAVSYIYTCYTVIPSKNVTNNE